MRKFVFGSLAALLLLTACSAKLYTPVGEPTGDEALDAAVLELLQERKGNCDHQAALMAVLLQRMGYTAEVVQGTFTREEGTDPVDHAWVCAMINGAAYFFDPLYGASFAEDEMEYCMASEALLAQTHQWK